MKVLEILNLDRKKILVCEIFEDDIITNKLQINNMTVDKFVVEPVKNCFSIPTTRNIVLSNYDGDKITDIEFV